MHAGAYLRDGMPGPIFAGSGGTVAEKVEIVNIFLLFVEI